VGRVKAVDIEVVHAALTVEKMRRRALAQRHRQEPVAIQLSPIVVCSEECLTILACDVS